MTATPKGRIAATEGLLVGLPTDPFPSGWDLGQLLVQERPKALQAELELTLKVLENMADTALGTVLDQPLHTLSHIHSQLQTCKQPGPTAEPRPPSRRLSRWLHRLQEAQRKCVASGDQCV